MSAQLIRVKPVDFRRADRMRGLVIVGLTFGLCLLISVWAKRRALPEQSRPPGPPTSAGIFGFPQRVDALKALPRAREATRRDLLRGIVSEGVASDGSVNVSEGAGRVRYYFQSAPGQGPQPPREAQTLARRPYCGLQTVVIGKDGLVAEPDSAEVVCAPHQADPLPEPHCTLAEIWSFARARGVPQSRTARIEYFRALAGPAWRFEAGGGRNQFSLYGDCKRELIGRDASSVGPEYGLP